MHSLHLSACLLQVYLRYIAKELVVAVANFSMPALSKEILNVRRLEWHLQNGQK